MYRKIKVVLFGLMVATSASMAATSVDDFTLKDHKGNSHTLSQYKDSKAIVLLFVSVQCPISNAYNERMEALNKDYADKGVTVLALNSNKAESIDKIKEHAQKHDFSFPVLKDEKNTIADKLSASVTPEAYVLNSNLELLYQGRIDDSKKESGINTKDLRNALDQVLTGKSVSVTKTKAFGCSIKRVAD